MIPHDASHDAFAVAARPCCWVAAIPARDEALRIGGCLAALDAAAARCVLPVLGLVLANDCTDETAAVVRSASRRLRHVRLGVHEATLPRGAAHAGGARRLAVDAAISAAGASEADLLVTTDADARLAADALSTMERSFAAGAALVLARIACVADPYDPVPQAVLDWGTPQVEWRHRVRRLAETLRLGVLADPRCHDDYGAAGIAARIGTYRALGGFPSVPCEEDLRFVRRADEAKLSVDRRSGAVVHVLARATGRATGGMATALAAQAVRLAEAAPRLVERHDLTIARLRDDPSPARVFCADPPAVEPVEDAIVGIDRALERLGGAPCS